MRFSEKTANLKQSGIRAASTRCAEIKGINLGQGVCDLPIIDEIKQAAYQAIEANKNLYSPCEGIYPLREALADKLESFNHIKVDPKNEIIITHGSTGAFVNAVNTLFNPGDEIILFEPFYGYHKNILELNDITINTVAINLTDLSFAIDDLKQAVTPRTKGMVICTPNNPSGKVFTKEELVSIGKIAKAHNLWVITDEIYEYITYPGYQHISYASLADYKNHCITISGFSKTYNMTGWRLGYATGPADIIAKMALVQDLIYVCPATPLQHAVLAALQVNKRYYSEMLDKYLLKRDYLVHALTELGFKVTIPQGAYYLLADFSALTSTQGNYSDDEQAAQHLLGTSKVATVPGRSFYENPLHGKHILRFCYALDQDKIEQAVNCLSQASAVQE